MGGLPWGVGDELYTRAPLRLQGGGQVTLSDGTLLQSALVWFPKCTPSCIGAGNCCPGALTSTSLESKARLAPYFPGSLHTLQTPGASNMLY